MDPLQTLVVQSVVLFCIIVYGRVLFTRLPFVLDPIRGKNIHIMPPSVNFFVYFRCGERVCRGDVFPRARGGDITVRAPFSYAFQY